MDHQTYMSNQQNIMQMYENLIRQAFQDNNITRIEGLMKERDERLDGLRSMYFDEAYKGKIINLRDNK